MIGTPCILLLLLCVMSRSAVLPPAWADPERNPCANQPGGWQLIYWPEDGKCYRIFQVGAPCPPTMEIAPDSQGIAHCRCPPNTAQSARDALCHQLFGPGPCNKGEYFAPVPTKSPQMRRWGTCREYESCQEPDEIYWPKDEHCYRKHTRGPCPKGQLLISDPPRCHCESEGELGQFFWSPVGTCYEHYTRGPCTEKGDLFLPGGICGCLDSLPHYHDKTKKCYPLGETGPCPPGHQFLVVPASESATCVCREDYVLWSKDGACYRLYTRGPCPESHILLDVDTCVPIPCKRGRLYFPDDNSCHRVGTQGPCPRGQLVLFENSIKPTVQGISYKGMCGCADPYDSCSEDISKVVELTCRTKEVLVNGTCYALYTRGPCSAEEWLVPDRDTGLSENLSDRKIYHGRCDCKPGYNLSQVNGKSVCQPPTIALAKYLNQNFSK